MTKSTPTPAEILGIEDEAEAEDLSHPILSPEEVKAAKAEARAQILAKQREAAKARLIAEETARLQREEGLTTGDAAKDEFVSITLDLAEHSDKITLSGTEYHHGFTYTVPRHIADTLREIMSRGHDHQNEIEGKGISERFRRPRATIVSAKTGIKNAPQAVA